MFSMCDVDGDDEDVVNVDLGFWKDMCVKLREGSVCEKVFSVIS